MNESIHIVQVHNSLDKKVYFLESFHHRTLNYFMQGIKYLIYGTKTIDFIFAECFISFFTKMTVQDIAVMRMTH